jgi:hypothetical protein
MSNIIPFPDPDDAYAIPFSLDIARKYHDIIVALLGTADGFIYSLAYPNRLCVRLCTNAGLKESSALGSDEVPLAEVPHIANFPILLGRLRSEDDKEPFRIVAIGELL